MFKKIVAVIVLLVVAVLIFAATKPDTFRVERSITIQAPPEKVFGLINDFGNWRAWSPWENLDPQMKRTYSASTVGQGAWYEWAGDDKVGKGRMEITESSPHQKILIKLDFTDPFPANNTAEFDFSSAGAATRVTWAMYGPSPFISKIFTVFMSMDKMIGGDFEKGLANLQKTAES